MLDPPEGTPLAVLALDALRADPPGHRAAAPPGRRRCASEPSGCRFGLHHPVWVDDPDFELDDHLTGPACPSPGGKAELDAFVAAVMSRQLDPDRPLWEMHVVEGLEGDRTALIAKVHHAILDGVSGASVLAAFLDLNAAVAGGRAAAGVEPGAAALERADAATRRLVAGRASRARR